MIIDVEVFFQKGILPIVFKMDIKTPVHLILRGFAYGNKMNLYEIDKNIGIDIRVKAERIIRNKFKDVNGIDEMQIEVQHYFLYFDGIV